MNNKSFWNLLVEGADGLPDEAAFSYLIIQLVIVLGMLYNTWVSKHFAIMDFVGGECALIPLYQAGDAARKYASKPGPEIVNVKQT